MMPRFSICTAGKMEVPVLRRGRPRSDCMNKNVGPWIFGIFFVPHRRI